MENSNQYLGTERIGKLMTQYAVPCIISLLVGALYNIVDQLFIANASYLGSDGNAANTVVMSVVSSLVVTAIYLIFQNPIIAMFGGTVNEATFAYSKEYFFYITLGIPFYMFGQAMNPVIRADGSPKFAMAATMVGAITNIILDPVFIFCFHWGMMGAAVATVLGQIFTAVLSVWYIVHMKVIKPSKGDFRPDRGICGRTLFLGITSFLSQISLFGAANESSYYTEFALKAFRIYLCMVILACVNKACFIFLQAMGKAAASTALSMIREVVFGVGFALHLPVFFGLDGVLYSMPVSDVLTFVVAVFLICGTYRELNRKGVQTA